MLLNDIYSDLCSCVLPFGKEKLIRLTVCSLCIMSFLFLIISQFGFEGETLVLIIVPDHCLHFTFQRHTTCYVAWGPEHIIVCINDDPGLT